MAHSHILATSGTVLNITDPSTGMYLDVTFQPGQQHRTLKVMMHGKLYTVQLRLVKIDEDTEHDLVATLRVPSAPSDAPPVRDKSIPHPATVLKGNEVTRAGVEGARANPVPHPATVPNANAPHPATVLHPNDVTRAALSAIRSDNKPVTRQQHVAQQTQQAAAQSEIDKEQQEPVMTDAELGELRTDDAMQRQKNSLASGGGVMTSLEPLIEGDVQMHLIDEHPMSEEEIVQLQEDAAEMRDRSDKPVEGENKPEFVEEDEPAKPSAEGAPQAESKSVEVKKDESKKGKDKDKSGVKIR